MATGGIDITNSYKILLMNCNGPAGSTVPLRRQAFNEVLEDVKPSIVFTQECAPGIYPYSDRYRQICGDGSASNSNTGFIYNIDEFKAPILNLLSHLEPLLLAACNCPQRIAKKFKERVSIALFESKREPNFQVLAVSWHGPHSNAAKGEEGFGDEDKRMLMVHMFDIVSNLHSSLGTLEGKYRTVLIGGDFNLDISKWPEQVPGCFGYQICMYSSEGGIRENENQIDFFVSSTDLVVQNVGTHIMPPTEERQVRESTLPENLRVEPPDVTSWAPEKLFDHDPIEATINLPTYSSVPVTGLTDALSQLSLSQNTLPSALLPHH